VDQKRGKPLQAPDDDRHIWLPSASHVGFEEAQVHLKEGGRAARELHRKCLGHDAEYVEDLSLHCREVEGVSP